MLLREFRRWALRPLLISLVAFPIAASAGCGARRIGPRATNLLSGDYARVTVEEIRQTGEDVVAERLTAGEAEAALTALLQARLTRGASTVGDAAVTEALIELDALATDERRAVPPALALLATDPSRVVRYHALRYLRHYTEAPGVAPAIVAQRDTDDPLIAVEARLIADASKLR